MKARIKRKVPFTGSMCYFEVYSVSDEGKESIVKSCAFKIGEPEWSLYHEKINYDDAMDVAKAIENADGEVIKVVYETGKEIIK